MPALIQIHDEGAPLYPFSRENYPNDGVTLQPVRAWGYCPPYTIFLKHPLYDNASDKLEDEPRALCFLMMRQPWGLYLSFVRRTYICIPNRTGLQFLKLYPRPAQDPHTPGDAGAQGDARQHFLKAAPCTMPAFLGIGLTGAGYYSLENGTLILQVGDRAGKLFYLTAIVNFKD